MAIIGEKWPLSKAVSELEYWFLKSLNSSPIQKPF